MVLAERLKVLRATLGISAREMSARLQLSPSLWSQFESGHREPGALAIRALHRMNVNMTWLFEGTGEMWMTPPSEQDEQRDTIAMMKLYLDKALSSSSGQRLISWQRVVQKLEIAPGGALTLESLVHELASEFTPAQIVEALNGLRQEGLVASTAAGYRLIKVTASEINNEGAMRTLMAIRTLATIFLPEFERPTYNGKTINSELYVERGQGAARARVLIGRIREWIAAQPQVAPSESYEMINLIVSVVVREPK